MISKGGNNNNNINKSCSINFYNVMNTRMREANKIIIHVYKKVGGANQGHVRILIIVVDTAPKSPPASDFVKLASYVLKP